MRRAAWHIPAAALALALAYYAAARLGLALAFEGSNASPVWPPSGIALAAVALGGLRLLPGVALGAFAANGMVFAANQAAELPTVLVASLTITAGNALEAAVGAVALRRWIGAHSPFERLADVAKFLVVALAAAALGAAVGTATLLATGIVPAAAGATVALTWWTGDTTGMLVIAPLLMAGWRSVGAAPDLRRSAEALLLLALLAALGAAVFVHPDSALGADRRLVWLFVPCVAWAAFRHGPQGAAGATLLIAGLAVWGTTRGLGPFARGSLNDALIVLETFVGLIAVTGLVLAADRRERERLGRAATLRRDLVTPWAVLLGCLAVAVVGWHVVASDTERRAQERFAFVAAEVGERVQARMAANEQILRGAAALFGASQSVEREEWHAYVERLQLEQSYPGIQAVGFALRLAAGEREAHVRQLHAEGHADYALRPDGERDEYTAIVYIEPFDARNRRAFGYDMTSEPVRRAAMHRARDSGRAALSGKVKLLQETSTGVQAGTLLYLPVYRNGAPVGTLAERRAALLGYVYSPFRMDNLMRGALGSLDAVEGVAVRLYSGDAAVDAELLYGTGAATAPAFALGRALDVAGQRWTLRVESLPAFEAAIDRSKAQIVLVAGVGVSLLLFGLVRSLTMTRERAELLAADMTAAAGESEARFRSLAESAGEAIVIADGSGRMLSFNRAAQAMFGHSEAEALGADLALLMPERFRAAHRAGMQRVAAGGQTRVIGRTVALAGLDRDGREFPIELSLSGWQNASGARYFSGIIRDITERERVAQALRDSERAAKQELALRMQADAELAEKNAALTRSNTELAQFAYVASHDLQEPLRTVASYSQLLLRRHRPALPAEAQEFLDFIGDGAKRAQALIADLLDLARIDSTAQPLAPVALEEVFDEARRRLGAALADSGAALSHDALPTVLGDRAQLVQLLQNLLGNAIKFRGAEAPRVHVGVAPAAGGWRIAVTDNGIGIDPRFHDRIFELFHRLHRADYPGTGIGLAICKKVVERHGGRIGVASAPGQGATFFFTLCAPVEEDSP